MNIVMHIQLSELSRALSLAFLHSLWQGLIAAIFVMMTRIFGKNLGSNRRYLVFTSIVLVFVLVNISGFLNGLSHSIRHTGSSSGGVELHDTGSMHVPAASFFDQLISFCILNSSLIVSLWFLVFCFRILGMVRSMGHIRQLRTRQLSDPPNEWKIRLRELSAELRLNAGVQLMQSALTQVPLVVGHLKPLILVPVGFFTGLTCTEVEAILLHELAHIKRRDFLVNLLQSLVEAVYFFNPFLLFISSQVRQEREYCCDDMAIGISGDKQNFVKALVTYQEAFTLNARYAMLLFGNKHQLLNRARRLLVPAHKSNGMEKFALYSGMIVLAGLFVFASAPQANKMIFSRQKIEKTNPAEEKIRFVKSNPGLVPDLLSSIKKPERSKFKTLPDSLPVIADTIPKNASKDFIAGYNAAIKNKLDFNYQVNEKFQLELALLNKYKDSLTIVEKPFSYDFKLKFENAITELKDSVTKFQYKKLIEEKQQEKEQ
jgi:beta-lactamase regulating signal transducer with metallopeptidase domain